MSEQFLEPGFWDLEVGDRVEVEWPPGTRGSIVQLGDELALLWEDGTWEAVGEFQRRARALDEPYRVERRDWDLVDESEVDTADLKRA